MKKIFTNVDFSGNTVANVVIATKSADPSGSEVGYGYVYRNSQTDHLRVYTENGWEDLVRTPSGKILKIVETFAGESGRGDTLYLKNVGTDKYDMYAYLNGSFCQLTAHTLHWSDIIDAPNILDCSYVGNNEELSLYYINQE